MKTHLQHPEFTPPTTQWDVTAALCGFACGAQHLAAKGVKATCRLCLRAAEKQLDTQPDIGELSG